MWKEIEDNNKALEVISKSFANHESIKAIKENDIEKNLTAGNSHLPKVSARDVEQLLKNTDGKKSTGIDKIPTKLIKLCAKVLSQPLAIAIDNISTTEYFQIMLKLHVFLLWLNILMINIS